MAKKKKSKSKSKSDTEAADSAATTASDPTAQQDETASVQCEKEQREPSKAAPMKVEGDSEPPSEKSEKKTIPVTTDQSEQEQRAATQDQAQEPEAGLEEVQQVHPLLEPLPSASLVIASSSIDNMVVGTLAGVSPFISSLEETLQEVTQAQHELLDKVHVEREVLIGNPAWDQVASTLDKVPEYTKRLDALRKQMSSLQETAIKMKKKAAQLHSKHSHKVQQEQAQQQRKREAEEALKVAPSTAVTVESRAKSKGSSVLVLKQ
eukprot:m.360009 g.360009  ORF g.360009 m.360009 type:complete len:264 (-) comp18851_c0_seq1:340-1131(-)